MTIAQVIIDFFCIGLFACMTIAGFIEIDHNHHDRG